MFKKSRVIFIILLFSVSIVNLLLAEKTSNRIAKISTLRGTNNQALVRGAGLYISSNTAPWSYGFVTVNTNILSDLVGPRFSIQNNSAVPLNFTVNATLSGGMTLGNQLGDVGPDRCVLAGIFTHWDSTLTLTEFNDADVMGSTPTAATNTYYADDAETNPTILGFNVGPGETPGYAVSIANAHA